MKKAMLSPSLMCCDFLHLEQQLRIFEKEGVEYLHIDLMDGHFVPNLTLGTDFVRQIKKATRIPLDIHLMVERPEEKIGWLALGKGDLCSIHAESSAHVTRAVQAVRETGAGALLALCPATPLTVLTELLPLLSGVLVMTVNPGFAGQKLVPGSIEKIGRVKRFLAESGFADLPIEVDGNVSYENAVKMRRAGADIFVAGTSSVFGEADLPAGFRKMRKCLDEA